MNFMWNELTKEELKHLYYNEGLSDRQIADLFGVPKAKSLIKERNSEYQTGKKYIKNMLNNTVNCLKS